MNHSLKPNSGSVQPSAGISARTPHTQPVELPAEIIMAANRGWHLFPFLARSRHASFAATLIGRTPPTNSMVDGSGVCAGRLLCHFCGIGGRGEVCQ